MKKLALCVITKEHSEIVEDVLSRCIEDYFRCGIDIYYYDSGITDATKLVIEKYREQGYSNLYHIKVNVDCTAEEKIEQVFCGYGLQGHYDYIWPTKDRAFRKKEALLRVMEAMEEEHDIIMFGAAREPDIDYIIYDEPKEFYRDFGVFATSLNTVIYSSSMLKNYGKDEFIRSNPEVYKCGFRAFIFLFSKLYEMGVCSIKVLVGETVENQNSSLGKSMWAKDTFELWKDCWLYANDILPSYYDEYKALIIKETASLPWILGSVERLLELREVGALVPENLEQIEKDWERVSDIPVEVVRAIAHGTYDYYKDVEMLKATGIAEVDLIVKVHKLVSESRMRVEEIPVDSVLQCVRKAFFSRYVSGVVFNGIFEGSLQDIGMTLKNATTQEEACAALRLVINLLLILAN